MPQLSITIGGREYRVACGAGEEAHLKKAAAALDNEAARLAASGQVLPEQTVLLMAGLMLADQVIAAPQGSDDAEVAKMATRVAALEAELAKAKSEKAALEGDLTAAKGEAKSAKAEAEAAAAQAAEGGSDDEAKAAAAAQIATLTEERDAALSEAEGLRDALETASKTAEAVALSGGDHEVLERMALELERLADEIETGGIQAKAS